MDRRPRPPRRCSRRARSARPRSGPAAAPGPRSPADPPPARGVPLLAVQLGRVAQLLLRGVQLAPLDGDLRQHLQRVRARRRRQERRRAPTPRRGYPRGAARSPTGRPRAAPRSRRYSSWQTAIATAAFLARAARSQSGGGVASVSLSAIPASTPAPACRAARRAHAPARPVRASSESWRTIAQLTGIDSTMHGGAGALRRRDRRVPARAVRRRDRRRGPQRHHRVRPHQLEAQLRRERALAGAAGRHCPGTRRATHRPRHRSRSARCSPPRRAATCTTSPTWAVDCPRTTLPCRSIITTRSAGAAGAPSAPRPPDHEEHQRRHRDHRAAQDRPAPRPPAAPARRLLHRGQHARLPAHRRPLVGPQRAQRTLDPRLGPRRVGPRSVTEHLRHQRRRTRSAGSATASTRTA